MFTRPQVEFYRERLLLLMLAAALLGLVISPPLLSVGLIGTVILGLLDPISLLNPRWKTNVGAFLKGPIPLATLSLYLLLLFGFWQTEDWPYYLERLRIKVPLLALPIAWAGLPVLSKKHFGALLGGFALLLALVLAVVLINYALHFEAVNLLIRQGRAVPVPRNHIRFSLLVATAALLALRAWELRVFTWRAAWLAVAAFLFIGLHLLAVRSGLLGAYAGAGVVGMALAYRSGRWLPAVGGLVVLCLLPILAYVAVPSFRTKTDYMRYELLHRDRSVDGNEYSDEGRLTSIRIGWEIFQDHPLLGVGPGNLLQETDRRYAEVLPGREGKRPHNQFVSALAGSGLLGGVVMLGAFAVLFIQGGGRRSPVLLGVVMVFFLSCLVENTLENTVGVSAFSLFVLLLGCALSEGDKGLPI